MSERTAGAGRRALRERFIAFSNPDMLHGPIFKSLVAFAIPVFLSMLFQNLYNTVDSLIVGHALGEVSLAAVGAGGVVLELLIGFATGAGMGMSMVIAQHYGAGDTEGIKKTSAACIVIGLALTLLTSVLGLAFARDLLRLLNTPEEIFEETYGYIRILVIFIFTTYLYNLFCGMLKALGNSLVPLLYLIFSSLLNIVLDILFVQTLGRGVNGAAEATVISQAVSALLSGLYILRKARLLVPERRHFRIEWKRYLEVAWAGVAMGLMNAIVMVGTLTLQYGINSLGTLTIAAHTAARKIFYFGTMPVNSLANSISMFASQNHGAKQYGRLRRAMRDCYLFDCAYALGITVLFWVIARPAMAFITGSTNDFVLSNGTRYLRFVAPFYLMLGVLGQSRFALQGLGRKVLPMLSSVIELVGKIVFTVLLVPPFGYSAVIVCEPIIWCFMSLQLVISLYRAAEMRRGKAEPFP